MRCCLERFRFLGSCLFSFVCFTFSCRFSKASGALMELDRASKWRANRETPVMLFWEEGVIDLVIGNMQALLGCRVT